MSERFWKIRCPGGLYHTSNWSPPNKTGKGYPTVGSARNGWNSIKAQHVGSLDGYELVELEAHEVRTERLK